MSTEALARLAYFPGLGKLLEERLPPKVIEIDDEGPRVAEMEDRADEGMGPRIERVIAAIQEAPSRARATSRSSSSCTVRVRCQGEQRDG